MSIWQSIIGKRNQDPEPLHFQVAGDTHLGRVRKHNEDSYLHCVSPDGTRALLGVADGMGGHEGGEVASYVAMQSLIAAWNRSLGSEWHNGESVRKFLDTSLRQANDHLFHVNQRLKIRRAMGTTATVGGILNNELIIVHAGDSRCYRLRKGRLAQLTADQNWMTEMVRSGRMSILEASMHPLSKTLTNCLGAMPRVDLVCSASNVLAGDRFLFCSDGVSSMIDDDEIAIALGQPDSPREVVAEAVRRSLLKGGFDNVSAVCFFA